MEMILFDGEFYLRITDVSPRSIRSSFPDDWVNVEDAQDDYPFLASINVETITSSYAGPLSIPIDEDSVLAIEEGEDDEIDGQDMRVFEIEYGAEVLLSTEAMSALVEAFAGMAPGIDVEDIIAQMADGAEIIYTVWIGEDDELIHRMDSAVSIDTTLDLMGTEFDFVQETEATAVYSDFGEDFDIEEPDA
jgi:hypothetical protein